MGKNIDFSKFKPFDKVVVMLNTSKGGVWTISIFAFDNGENVQFLIGSIPKSAIAGMLPFEGNEHLVGTKYKPEEEVELKKGELVYVFDSIENIEDFIIGLRKFAGICGDTILSKNKINWKYCIPYSKFNPNDMEETKKHILCVKNGILVKAF